jgi:hypothetical protein
MRKLKADEPTEASTSPAATRDGHPRLERLTQGVRVLQCNAKQGSKRQNELTCRAVHNRLKRAERRPEWLAFPDIVERYVTKRSGNATDKRLVATDNRAILLLPDLMHQGSCPWEWCSSPWPTAITDIGRFIVFAQKIGLTLGDIGKELAKLPADRVPTRGDWAHLSGEWKKRIDQRIAEL